MLKMLNAHNAMRTVLENRRITLELALRQLAQTVGGQAPDQEEIAAFFHDFMDGVPGMPLKRRLPMIPMI